jgi:uncharacterized Zn finger protein (UPF0148 family)
MIAALNCLNCGAPLKISAQQTRAICLYCNSTLQIEREAASEPTAAVENILSEADMARIKQLLLAGRPSGCTVRPQAPARRLPRKRWPT